VMDAFSQPKMGYDPHSKAFSFSFDSKRPMNPPASARYVRAASDDDGAHDYLSSSYPSLLTCLAMTIYRDPPHSLTCFALPE